MICLAVVVGLLLSADPGPVQGAHFSYLVENAEFNPNGTTNGRLWGVQRSWVINSQALSVCSDWGSSYSSIPSPIQQAIADWEAVLPGTQFNQNCSAQVETIWFKNRSISGIWPSQSCDPAGWACVPPSFPTFDSIREAYYFTNPEIWIDDASYAHTDSGLRYSAAHELGHVFGLDEEYIESGFVCNTSGPSSVMNMGVRSGLTITGPCSNGSMSPTQRDIDLVRDLYEADSPDQITTSLTSPNILYLQFFDRSWAESGYRFYAYWWNGSYGQYTGENWVRTYRVGGKDHWNDTTYYKGASQPDGYYRICASATTGIYGETASNCSAYVHMADHDPVAEYVFTVGPAAINLSSTTQRAGWALGEVSNQGDHDETVSFSLTQTPASPGCSRIIQLILPGSEDTYLYAGEQKLVVYRTLYQCHSPATPGGYNQLTTLTVSHPGGGEPLDAQANNNASQNRFVIIQ